MRIIAFAVSDDRTGVGELCHGSTYDSDSYCLGSNPSSPAIFLPPWSSGLGHRPLKAATRVRIPSEVPIPLSALNGFSLFWQRTEARRTETL